MRTTTMRQAAAKAKARVGSSKQSGKATAKASAKASATEHIEWRGRRITKFESRVYEIISTIPAGKVSTYGEVARALRSGPRPVGQALRKNPFAPEVPCHRVIAASREIGGFMGSIGDEDANICKKRELLTKEGVIFTPNRKIDESCLHVFES